MSTVAVFGCSDGLLRIQGCDRTAEEFEVTLRLRNRRAASRANQMLQSFDVPYTVVPLTHRFAVARSSQRKNP